MELGGAGRQRRWSLGWQIPASRWCTDCSWVT